MGCFVHPNNQGLDRALWRCDLHCDRLRGTNRLHSLVSKEALPLIDLFTPWTLLRSSSWWLLAEPFMVNGFWKNRRCERPHSRGVFLILIDLIFFSNFFYFCVVRNTLGVFPCLTELS